MKMFETSFLAIIIHLSFYFERQGCIHIHVVSKRSKYYTRFKLSIVNKSMRYFPAQTECRKSPIKFAATHTTGTSINFLGSEKFPNVRTSLKGTFFVALFC